MTKVVVFKDLPSYFFPGSSDCRDGCPIAMYRQLIDDLDCNYFDDYWNNDRCPFNQEYGEEVNKYMEKIIEIVEGE